MKDEHVDGAALREMRERRDMRQMDVAERAKVSAQHLCRIESNRGEYCSRRLVRRLADILECDPADFIRPGRHPRLSLPGEEAA